LIVVKPISEKEAIVNGDAIKSTSKDSRKQASVDAKEISVENSNLLSGLDDNPIVDNIVESPDLPTESGIQLDKQQQAEQEKLDRSRQALADTLKQQLDQVNKEKQQAQLQLRKLKRDIQKSENQLRGEIEALRRAIARSASQDVKNRQRVQFLQDLVKRTQGCIDELAKQVAQAHANHANVSSEVNGLEATLLQLREEHREAEQRYQRQMAAVQRQNREQQSRLQAAELARDETLSKIARLHDQQLPAVTKDVNSLMTRLDSAQQRMEELRQQYEARDRQQTTREKEGEAGLNQVKRDVTVAQERNQSLLRLIREESTFRDRLRNELTNLHALLDSNTTSSKAPPLSSSQTSDTQNTTTDTKV
jgi:chromosome segregation ATPase